MIHFLKTKKIYYMLKNIKFCKNNIYFVFSEYEHCFFCHSICRMTKKILHHFSLDRLKKIFYI